MSVISDSDRDDDSDGITNKDEEAKGTNPFTPDTDGDGISDENEISLGTDPLNPDSDNDGVSDGYELMAGLDRRKNGLTVQQWTVKGYSVSKKPAET